MLVERGGLNNGIIERKKNTSMGMYSWLVATFILEWYPESFGWQRLSGRLPEWR